MLEFVEILKNSVTVAQIKFNHFELRPEVKARHWHLIFEAAQGESSSTTLA